MTTDEKNDDDDDDDDDDGDDGLFGFGFRTLARPTTCMFPVALMRAATWQSTEMNFVISLPHPRGFILFFFLCVVKGFGGVPGVRAFQHIQ